jgi:CheY-like chemotaxis protein
VENLSPSRRSISNSPVSQARVRVLIADDERIIADTLEMILAEEGLDAISVYNGREAIDKENALTLGDQNPPRQRWGEQVSAVQIRSSSVLFGHCPDRVDYSLRSACMGFVLAALRAGITAATRGRQSEKHSRSCQQQWIPRCNSEELAGHEISRPNRRRNSDAQSDADLPERSAQNQIDHRAARSPR